MQIPIVSRKAIGILAIIVLLLTLASVSGQFYKYFIGGDRYLVVLFNVDAEWNIPTVFAAFTLLLCSGLITIIGLFMKQIGDRFARHWIALAIIFLGMSLDEVIQFHEQTIRPLRSLLNAKGIFYHAWVIPASLLVVIFVLSYLNFLANIPLKTRRLFVISGILYCMGVIGLEVIGGLFVTSVGQDNFSYAMITNLEEVLEMIGILVFIYGLMEYIGSNIGRVQIEFRKE
jgi:hypothetical protein